MYYLIEEHQIASLRRQAKRLYTENRMNGDEMRDMAHALSAIANSCEQVPLPEEGPRSQECAAPEHVEASGPPLKGKLAGIAVLWRQPDTLALWGLPYVPNGTPYDLWKARRDYVPPKPGWYGSKQINLDDWVWLGSPGWWGSMSKEDQEAVKAFLETVKDDIPHDPYGWSKLHNLK